MDDTLRTLGAMWEKSCACMRANAIYHIFLDCNVFVSCVYAYKCDASCTPRMHVYVSCIYIYMWGWRDIDGEGEKGGGLR